MADFSKMRWRIDKIPLTNNVLDRIPELAALFSTATAKLSDFSLMKGDLLIRYIVYVYHQKSPFAMDEQNIVQRKINVLRELKQDPVKLGKLISNNDAVANSLKLHFLKFENSTDWLEICQYLEVYYMVMNSLTDETASQGSKSAAEISKIKLGVIKEMKGIKTEIDNISIRLFRNDVDITERDYKGLGNFVASYLEEEKRRNILPEDVVFNKKKEAEVEARK